jgi:Gram-negative bacterial TonB protein C-terminal
MNTRPLVHFPEEQHTPSAASSCLGGTDEDRARLLELRTESGTLYVCPSKWQRLRLLWTFRHFHVLPQQVLSRRVQRLIEKLSRSAVITPGQPVARSAILGVVEKSRIKPMAAAPHVVTMRTERKAPQTSPASPLIPGLPSPGHHQRLFFDRPGSKFMEPAATSRKAREGGLPFRQWEAVAWLTAVCLLVIVAKFVVVSLPSKSAQMMKPGAPTAPVTHPAVRVLPAAAPLPALGKPRLRPATLAPAATFVARHTDPLTRPAQASIKDSSAAVHPKSLSIAPFAPDQRPFVSELPQGHFAAPIVADPNQVGELHLKALIAADGSVKDVTVVSGDPKLAQAGIRAVRRWHYNPYEASATQAERETLINMKFFGEDAVSVTSVAR